MTRVAILQSNYIPWKGYFDLINSVDDFVIYDTAQYTKNDWRNRNKIKTNTGTSWLTIPVLTKGHLNKRIHDIKVSDHTWQKKHWSSLRQNYSKARYFSEISAEFERFYVNTNKVFLSEINLDLIHIINRILGIETNIHFSSDFNLLAGKSERLLSICNELGAKTYLSGPAARDYLDVSLFSQNGIDVEWMNYSGYPEYQQFFPPFEHGVTILDLLFNEGSNATKFMKSFV